MQVSRRRALALCSTLGIGALTGCRDRSTDRPALTLSILNDTAEPRTVDVELLEAGGVERSESVAFREEIEVPAADDENEYEADSVVESQRYLARAELLTDPSTATHYHYYPDCDGRGEPIPRLYIYVRNGQRSDRPYLQFDQNVCSDDSGSY